MVMIQNVTAFMPIASGRESNPPLKYQKVTATSSLPARLTHWPATDALHNFAAHSSPRIMRSFLVAGLVPIIR
ncbi:MAG: hypothetical protein KDA77_06160 [Planctomycetaceae bacterium]|nr:hypothetical protein [Planctomycetaceae bacterium]